MANKTVAELATISGLEDTQLIPVYDPDESGEEKLKHVAYLTLKTDTENHEHLQYLEGAGEVVLPQTGGGVLTDYRINELQDSSSYTLPLADSVDSGAWLLVEICDEYSAETPTVTVSGSDTITDSTGTDTDVLFNAGSVSVRFISDGTSDWRI